MQKVLYQRKAVRVTVYVVKPGKSTKHASNTEKCPGRRHQALRCTGSAYDRKSQLLLYSRQLRATAWQASGQKPRPLNKVKEVLHIASSHKPQHKVREALLQIATTHNHKPQHIVTETLQMTSSHNPETKVKEVRRITHTSSWKVVPVEQKPAHAKLPRPPPSCFGDWKKFFLPGFLVRGVKLRARSDKRKESKKKMSISITDKMNAIMMSSKMKKERIGAMAKFLSTIGKRR